jgi:hypothetical protein
VVVVVVVLADPVVDAVFAATIVVEVGTVETLVDAVVAFVV